MYNFPSTIPNVTISCNLMQNFLMLPKLSNQIQSPQNTKEKNSCHAEMS